MGVLIVVRSWHCCCCVFDVLAALQFYDLDTVRRRLLECVLPFFLLLTMCTCRAHVVKISTHVLEASSLRISAHVLEAFQSEHFGYLFLPTRLLLAAITLRTLAKVRNDLSGN
jgi:hypothetical protein